jgi:hypothetical protein
MNTQFGSFEEFFRGGTLYLTLLHCDSEDVAFAFDVIRELCKRDVAVSELKQFLRESGWREHLTACAAALADEAVASKLSDDFWVAFDSGSWVSPQLAVTSWVCDSRFDAKAKSRVEQLCIPDTKMLDTLAPLRRHVIGGPGSASDRAAKSLSALIYLLGQTSPSSVWLENQLVRREVQNLLARDVDRGGQIAERWLVNVRARSADLGLQLR